jgi:hypothetical protein
MLLASRTRFVVLLAPAFFIVAIRIIVTVRVNGTLGSFSVFCVVVFLGATEAARKAGPARFLGSRAFFYSFRLHGRCPSATHVPPDTDSDNEGDYCTGDTTDDTD